MAKRTSKGLGSRLSAEGGLALAEHPVQFMTVDGPGTFIKVPIHAILANPDQPRKHFDEGALAELATSIRDNGILQPVIVKSRGGGAFLLVAGERRFRAAKLAGLEELPAILTSGDENEIALIENVQRENLTPIEEAEALGALQAAKHYSHEDLAAVVGKSRVTVTEILSLNRLPGRVKEECRAPDIATKTHLLQILREPTPEKQLALWELIKTGEVTTRSLRPPRASVPKKGRPKHLSRVFAVADLDAVVTVRFSRPRASLEEFHQVLLAATKEVKRELKQG